MALLGSPPEADSAHAAGRLSTRSAIPTAYFADENINDKIN